MYKLNIEKEEQSENIDLRAILRGDKNFNREDRNII
jgi:hypothetical protein